MNKKEREQLLRDTLDQCLSGLDSLPSDRAEVNRRLDENAPEAKRRIPWRRLAVPAAALVLCACLLITGTHLGMIPWPDRIRPQETQFTAPPVPLAQPTGEGTETPESSAEEEDALQEIETRFAGFFTAWNTGDLTAMLELCSPSWVSAQANPRQALFGNILLNRTPSGAFIESVSGTADNPVLEVTAMVTMNYNNGRPESPSRMIVRMVREDGAWYIDPESLVNFRVITTPEPEAEPSPEPGSEPDLIARLREIRPNWPANFVPVGLSCEKEGFRLEVISASVNEQSAFFIYSLQNLEGNRQDFSSGVVELLGTYPWPYRLVFRCDLLYDALSRTSYFAAEYEAQPSSDAGEVFHDAPPQLLAELTTLYFQDVETLAVGSFLEEYGDRATLTDIPELISTFERDDNGIYHIYDTAWFREQGIRVLDYTSPLSVSLHKNLELSGIGLIDGQLHVQLHFVDNRPVIRGPVYYTPLAIVGVCNSPAPAADSMNPLEWDADGDGQVDYIEYVIPCESEDEAGKLEMTLLETTGAVEGSWRISVPLETVWTGDPDVLESILAETRFLPRESPAPAWEQVLPDPLNVLRPGLQDQLFPVNLYWTDGPVRLDVISAAVGETESWVIFTLENGRLRDPHTLSGGLDDSPLPGTDVIEYYDLGLIPSRNAGWYAARIRHLNPDPERKSVLFSVSNIDTVYHQSEDNMRSLFLIYECLSGDLVDLPASANYSAVITENGQSITPEEFRKSGRKILDYTHTPNKHLFNGLELSGIGLEEDGNLHIQLHTVEPYTNDDGTPWTQLHSWYMDFDGRLQNRVCTVSWPDPASRGKYSYTEYILPWTMEDFGKYHLSIELTGVWPDLPVHTPSLDIFRPE